MVPHWKSVTLATTVLAVTLALTSAESNQLPPVRAKPSVLPTCIDDSDCAKKGANYRCFLYVCYPWKDDSELDPEEQHETCRSNEDCQPQEECIRHKDVRSVTSGVCFDKDQVERCSKEADCAPGLKCCGNNCCEDKYFKQFAELPCYSDYGCQDLHLGKFCCPKNNSTNVCCNTDPNPPPTQAPSTRGTGASGASSLASLTILTATSIFLARF